MGSEIESKEGAVIAGVLAGAASGGLLSLGQHWGSAVLLVAGSAPIIISAMDALSKNCESPIFFKHAKTGFASIFGAAVLTNAAIQQPWEEWGGKAKVEVNNAVPPALNKTLDEMLRPISQ